MNVNMDKDCQYFLYKIVQWCLKFVGNNKSNDIHLKNDYTHMEDELYVKGHTVIWSRTLVNNIDNYNNSRKIICSYTLESPVCHALWSKFYCDRPKFGNSENFYDIAKDSTLIESICIADLHTIKVFTVKGEDFTNSVPFVIGKLWNTSYGLLIEKQNESKFTMLFA